MAQDSLTNENISSKRIKLVDLIIEEYITDEELNEKIEEIFNEMSSKFDDVKLGIKIYNPFLGIFYIVLNEKMTQDLNSDYKQINISSKTFVNNSDYDAFIASLK